jgi:hypothetical protein
VHFAGNAGPKHILRTHGIVYLSQCGHLYFRISNPQNDLMISHHIVSCKKIYRTKDCYMETVGSDVDFDYELKFDVWIFSVLDTQNMQ